jgi:hypothetical protein
MSMRRFLGDKKISLKNHNLAQRTRRTFKFHISDNLFMLFPVVSRQKGGYSTVAFFKGCVFEIDENNNF